MVNWKRVCAPRDHGGLGIKDIAAFSTSLRLRWLWHNWDAEQRPWQGTAVPCSVSDRCLFAACTTIHIGNGKLARFWTDCWLDGEAPARLAHALFKLAVRKNLSVEEALQNGRWMRGLRRMDNRQDLDLFVLLWGKIQEVQLTDEADTISWSLFADKVYSAKSAYEVQFFGRIKLPDLERVWRVKAEEKVRFFTWLLLQDRLWTADRLQRRGWAHDARCCLCDQVLESANHLFLECPFAKEVWNEMVGSDAALVHTVTTVSSIPDYWTELSKGSKEQITTTSYTVWNIWNERNRRIFQGKKMRALAVANLTRNEVGNFRLAHRVG